MINGSLYRRKEEPIVDADPYSNAIYNFTGSGRMENWLSA